MRPLTNAFAIILCICLGANDIRAQDLSSGLISVWEFDEISGTVAYDEFGDNDGDILGAILNQSGKINKAYAFSGDYVDVGDLTFLPLTVSCWFKVNNILSSYLFHHFFETYLSIDVSGKIRWGIYDGTSFGTWAYSNTTIMTGVWYHVVATWNGVNTTQIYINGVLEATGSSNSNHYGDDGNRDWTYIGRRADKNESGFDGLIDQPAIWNRVLSSAEISQLYNSGNGLPFSQWNITSPLAGGTISPSSLTINSGESPGTISNDTPASGGAGNYSYQWQKSTNGSTFSNISGATGTSYIAPTLTQDTWYRRKVTDDASAVAYSNISAITVITSGGLSCSNTITTFPYTESFENMPNTWENTSISDDIDWTRQTGSTPSSSTGPAAAQDESYYYFTESSVNGTGFPNKTAILCGPCFDLSEESSAQLSFYYHMYGSSMGSLALEASADGTNWTSLWNLSGDQGNSWQQATVNLNTYIGNIVQFRFLGTTGSNYYSDMAVDNLSLSTVSGESSFWAQSGINIYPTNSGNVGIGTSSPDQKLTVNGTIHAEEVIIDLSVPAPDYVFEKGYELSPISELKDFIEKNNHLPEFPPASVMEAEGITISQMNLNLLKRIEELTLYIIEQEKRIHEIEKQYNIENR